MALSLEYLLAPPPRDGESRYDGPSSHGTGDHKHDHDRDRTDTAQAAQLRHADAQIAGVAFDAYVRAYYTVLCDSAESYLGDRAAAEEVTDRVFARVWDRRRLLVVRTTIVAYLFGAVRNASLNAIAKRRFADRRGVQALAAHEPPGMSNATMYAPGPDTMVEDAERRLLVWRAVETLPERARAILTLRWRMQLDWEEIAEALGMTANAAQVQHSRALVRLRERLPELRALL